MILRYLTLALLFYSSIASAEFTLGIGHTVYNPSDNGVWWQQGLDHHIDNESNSIQIGYKFNTEYSVSVGYMNLGKINSWALATIDQDFNGNGCIKNPCVTSDVYIGTGEVQGFYLTSSPEYKYKEIKLFANLGLWVFQAKFNMVIAVNYQNKNTIGWNFNKNEDWQVRPVIGIGLEYNKLQFIVNAYGVDSGSEQVDSIPNYKGYAINFSINKLF